MLKSLQKLVEQTSETTGTPTMDDVFQLGRPLPPPRPLSRELSPFERERLRRKACILAKRFGEMPPIEALRSTMAHNAAETLLEAYNDSMVNVSDIGQGTAAATAVCSDSASTAGMLIMKVRNKQKADHRREREREKREIPQES